MRLSNLIENGEDTKVESCNSIAFSQNYSILCEAPLLKYSTMTGPQNQWLVMEFEQTKEKIDNIVDEWLNEWKKPVIDNRFSTEVDPRKEGTYGTQ